MKVLLCLIALIGLIGCGEPRRDQMQKIGLLNQHNLRHMKQNNGFSGSLDGSFFLGSGSISGSINSETQLQFFWGRTPDEFIPTTLPFRMFKFVIDNARLVPTVEFVFDEDFLNSSRWAYSESHKANLNRWLDESMIKGEYLRVVIIRISQKDLENEIFIPKSTLKAE